MIRKVFIPEMRARVKSASFTKCTALARIALTSYFL